MNTHTHTHTRTHTQHKPRIEKFQDQVVRFCQKRGFVQSMLGRQRFFPGLAEHRERDAAWFKCRRAVRRVSFPLPLSHGKGLAESQREKRE